MKKAPDMLASSASRRDFARDLGGCRLQLVDAQATRRRDLAAVLEFSAGRRLGRRRLAPNGYRAAEHGSARLLSRARVTDDLMTLEVSRPPGFDYRPGQHVKLGLAGLRRTYSLVSAPHQDHLEFFVEVFPQGRLSQRLRTLEPGAPMVVRDRPRGSLRVDERYRNQLLIATVTGIAPYVSFARHHLHARSNDRSRRRFVILHGASFADELGYLEELSAAAARHPQTVAYHPTVSRPESSRNAGWTGLVGRVESHLDTLLERHALSRNDTAAFVCGNPDMVRSVAGSLRRRGFTTHTEPFE